MSFLPAAQLHLYPSVYSSSHSSSSSSSVYPIPSYPTHLSANPQSRLELISRLAAHDFQLGLRFQAPVSSVPSYPPALPLPLPASAAPANPEPVWNPVLKRDLDSANQQSDKAVYAGKRAEMKAIQARKRSEPKFAARSNEGKWKGMKGTGTENSTRTGLKWHSKTAEEKEEKQNDGITQVNKPNSQSAIAHSAAPSQPPPPSVAAVSSSPHRSSPSSSVPLPAIGMLFQQFLAEIQSETKPKQNPSNAASSAAANPPFEPATREFDSEPASRPKPHSARISQPALSSQSIERKSPPKSSQSHSSPALNSRLHPSAGAAATFPTFSSSPFAPHRDEIEANIEYYTASVLDRLLDETVGELNSIEAKQREEESKQRLKQQWMRILESIQAAEAEQEEIRMKWLGDIDELSSSGGRGFSKEFRKQQLKERIEREVEELQRKRERIARKSERQRNEETEWKESIDLRNAAAEPPSEAQTGIAGSAESLALKLDPSHRPEDDSGPKPFSHYLPREFVDELLKAQKINAEWRSLTCFPSIRASSVLRPFLSNPGALADQSGIVNVLEGVSDAIVKRLIEEIEDEISSNLEKYVEKMMKAEVPPEMIQDILQQ